MGENNFEIEKSVALIQKDIELIQKNLKDMRGKIAEIDKGQIHIDSMLNQLDKDLSLLKQKLEGHIATDEAWFMMHYELHQKMENRNSQRNWALWMLLATAAASGLAGLIFKIASN